MRNKVLTIAITAAITFAATFAATAVAANTGVINACVNSASGELKIVGPTDVCKNGETPLTWNQEGPAGPQGVPGTNGTNGANGVSGYVRVAWVAIPIGTSGTFGPDGTITNGSCNPANGCQVRVYCPTGAMAVGGGYTFVNSTDPNVAGVALNKILNVTQDRPSHIDAADAIPPFTPAGDLWRVGYNTIGIDPSNVPAAITVAVRCVTAN